MATATTLRARSMVPGLTVNDLQKSVRFYRDGLGFTVEEEVKSEGEVRYVTVAAGEAQLGLSQDDFAKGRDRAKGIGMRLFLETDQDLDALAQQARAAGIAVQGPAPLSWGPIGFTVTDPDGFNLTIAKPT